MKGTFIPYVERCIFGIFDGRAVNSVMRIDFTYMTFLFVFGKKDAICFIFIIDQKRIRNDCIFVVFNINASSEADYVGVLGGFRLIN